jgi:tripartite-type tricarboxylate transporter receptor subunit TctC
MVVPFPAGSSPDLIARIVTEKLALALGQPVVIENRPGAGGNIGTGAVAKAAPDGYTLLFTINGPLVTAPSLYRHLSYDPMKQLAPVTLVATSPNVLVIDARLPVHTLREFVALAKSKPGALNYGSVGNGSAAHLAMEQLKAMAGIDLQHVPYPGFPQITTAIVGGQVQAGFMVPAIAMPMVNAGKLRMLAVTTTGRVPAAIGADGGRIGLPGFRGDLVAGDPGAGRHARADRRPALSRTGEGSSAAMTCAKMRAQYFVPAGTAPASLRQTMVSEKARWDKVIRAAGVQPEN